MRLRQAGAILLLAAALFFAGGGSASAYEHRALIIVDELPGGQASTSQLMLENLLGHFWLPYDVQLLDDYRDGDIDGYRVTFYLGSVWNRELPPAFMADVIATNNRFVWINHNIWQLEWSQYEQAFQDKYGFTFTESVATSSYDHAGYQGRTFWRPQAGFGKTQILDAGVATTVSTITNGAVSFPHIIRSGNFYYVADDPMEAAGEESDYLVFADALHDMVGIDHAVEHRALVRIEDIDPTEDPVRIRAIADYLYGEGVPFSLAVIPRFEDPLGAQGPPKSLGLSDRPELVSALNYAVARGGTIVLHGYTHQYGSVANPYNGVTGLDTEFYIQRLDGFGNVVDVSPVPADSVPWVNGRIDSALAEMNSAGFAAPSIWVTPHYLASDLDNQVFASRFGAVYQRFTDFFLPYVIQSSTYGSRVIPENLGYIDPGVRGPALLIRLADKNLAVRDGFASFFYHSEVDLAYLQTTVAGLKAKGYTFVSAGDLAAAEPRDVTPPSISAVSPAGTIYQSAATISISYADTGDGIDLLPVAVTLDGQPLSGCAVGAGSVSCDVSGLAAGWHVIGGLVSDNAGNQSVIDSSFLVGDNTPPQVTYTGPGGYLDSSSVTITAGYSDPGLSLGMDLDSARVTLNGGEAQSCGAAAGGIECQLTGLADGVYSVVVAISDQAGNSSSAARSFTVDATAPVVSDPGPEGWVTTTAPVITAGVLETNLHAQPAWLYLDGGSAVACAVAGSTVNCPVSGLAQGVHDFRIEVYDTALNQGSASGVFHVDSAAPQVKINSPQGLVESTDVTVDVTLADSWSGVDTDSVEVLLDGAAVSCDVSATHVSCAAAGLGNGNHAIEVRAGDQAGNSGTYAGEFQTLFCTGDAPSLELAVGGPFWASYKDYRQRLLSVDYFINNFAGPDASNITVARSDSTSGVSMASISVDRFSIPAGGRVYIIFKYRIPEGVSRFRTTTLVSAMDDCGNPFGYPDTRSSQ